VGLSGVPCESHIVLQEEDLLLQRGRDHHLVCTVGCRAAAEDSVGVLEERDAPAGVQGLKDRLAIAIAGLGREHRVAVAATDRGAAEVIGRVEFPDRVGPYGEDGDGVIERRLVAATGLLDGDAVLHGIGHPRLVGDVKR